MRKLSSLLGPTVGGLATTLLTASLCILPRVAAINFKAAPSPNLDLSQLGRVALAGDFDAISLYQYEGQTQSSFSTNGSHSLLSRYPNGAFASVAVSDAYIKSMCQISTPSENLTGVIVGGNFTSLGGVPTQGGLALFNPNNSAITNFTLDGGLTGQVGAVYCDQQARTVYIGGRFTVGSSTNAIAYTESGWRNLPFAGFNGPVTSITKAGSGSIIFGGSFTGLGNTTTPQQKDVQTVALTSGDISGGPSSTKAGVNDPKSIVCPQGATEGAAQPWLLADNTPGFWQATFPFGFIPTKLRIYNAVQDGRGTKTFRFTASPINGIMNFTYVDGKGQTKSCTSECPLPENNATAQDFQFVNGVGMNAFKIDISAWYGAGGGLAGVELLQDDIYTFAIDNFNSPTCGSDRGGASATATGQWIQTPSGISTSEYLTARLSGNPVDVQGTNVVFRPNIKQSGNYSVTIFTPGCIQDNSCSARGRVNVTGIMGTGTATQASNAPVTTELYQTNNYDKYDQIYYGFVDASSDAFRPSITLTPSPGQSGPLTIVAQRIRFELQSSTGGLNGLFEFNPNVTNFEPDFSKSSINRAGMNLDPGAAVNALAVQDNLTYVAGKLFDDGYSNIFSVNGEPHALANKGLNGEVLAMIRNDTMLYVGGTFNGSGDDGVAGLNSVAAYDTKGNTWQPLGAGVDGPVRYIVPFPLNFTANRPETVISITGDFKTVFGFGKNASFAADGLAVWVPSRKNWLQNLDLSTITLSGQLTTEVEVRGQTSLFAGSVYSQASGASGAVELPDTKPLSLQQLPMKIQATPASPTPMRKRAIAEEGVNGIITGLMYNENNLNITILGGHFTAKDSNGANLTNLLFLNGSNSDHISGLPTGVDSGSTILALGSQGTTLFAGGNLTGKVGNDDVNGLVLYDLSRSTYSTTQPQPFTGSNGTKTVSVNAIAPQPSSTNVFVGGLFGSAASFSCPALCIYDTNRAQWNSPGPGLGGNVVALSWIDQNRLIIGGELTMNNSATRVLTYDAKALQYGTVNGANRLPGPITALTPGSNDGSKFWVAGKADNGSAYVERYDGSNWQSIGHLLGPESDVRGLQSFTLTEKHGKSGLVDQNQDIMVLGQLSIPNFGNASAALFNGTAFVPFALASTADNTAGSLSQVFVEKPQNFFKSGGNHLAVGFIVLIALAIALALIFLLVVAGIIAERVRRKREGYQPAPTQMFDKNNNMHRIPPEHLLGSVGIGQGRSGGGAL